MINHAVASQEEALGALTEPEAVRQDWPWTLFSVEHVGQIVIVVPTIDGGMFRYAQLHTEVNVLRRKLEQSTIGGLILDLHALNYVGSEVIGAIIALARKVEDLGGRAVFCRVVPQLQEILTTMGLQRLWAIFPTREAALEEIAKRRH